MKRKTILSLYLIITIVFFSIPTTVYATEENAYPVMENYGVDVDDIYIPSLPELEENPETTTLQFYNPLINNKSTPVKAQGDQGTCGIFATNALLETAGVYKTGLKYSLSEESMRFVLSNQLMYANNATEIGYYNYGIYEGRNFHTTATYLTNINQPIINNNTQKWVTPNLSDDIEYSNDKYVNSIYWPSGMDTSYCSYYAAGTKYINNEEIKDYILSNGCVYVTFYADLENGLNRSTNAFYTSERDMNHAVAVVGWDDNYSVDNFLPENRPSKNGAWMVKNSWGTSDTSDGYFWVSYEDVSFNYYNNASVVSDVSKYSKNEYMLSYDFMPMISHKKYSLTEDQNSIFMTNVYDVSEYTNDYGSVNKVTFFSKEIGSFYRIYLTALDSSESYPDITELGNYLYSGYIDSEGYYSVDLSEDFVFDENTDKIAVTIKIITDDEKECLTLTREYYGTNYKPSINAGESYIYFNDTWIDAYSESEFQGNFCIRPTLVRRTSITQDSTLSSNSLTYSGSDVTVDLNLNGNLLYSIKENGNTLLYEDNQFVRDEDSVTFKSSYLSSLAVNQYKNIVFEFTDGASQTLRITRKENLPDVSVSGKTAIGQTLTAQLSTDTTGATYQWQISDDGTTWTDISDATSETLSVTDAMYLKYIRVKINSTSDSNYVYPQEVISASIANKIILYGDVNLDGVVSINDSTLIQKYAVGSKVLDAEQLVAGDVNGDGVVNITDSTLINQYLSNSITSFPVESN